MTRGELVGAIVGGLTVLAMVGAAFVSYGRLQTLVEVQADTNQRQAVAIQQLTDDLHGFQDFFMAFLAARNATVAPLDLERFVPPHEHDGTLVAAAEEVP